MTKNKSRTRIKFNTRLKGLDFFAYQICLQKKKEQGRKKNKGKCSVLFSHFCRLFLKWGWWMCSVSDVTRGWKGQRDAKSREIKVGPSSRWRFIVYLTVAAASTVAAVVRWLAPQLSTCEKREGLWGPQKKSYFHILVSTPGLCNHWYPEKA